MSICNLIPICNLYHTCQRVKVNVAYGATGCNATNTNKPSQTLCFGLIHLPTGGVVVCVCYFRIIRHLSWRLLGGFGKTCFLVEAKGRV